MADDGVMLSLPPLLLLRETVSPTTGLLDAFIIVTVTVVVAVPFAVTVWLVAATGEKRVELVSVPGLSIS